MFLGFVCDDIAKLSFFLILLLSYFFVGSAKSQSVGVSCSVNGRTQMSSTAAEGLIQCRSGTWTSASQTVNSGGNSTPVTAIMQYQKTLVTTVDSCTDAVLGFKGFNPDTGQTMICGGASKGWKIDVSSAQTFQDKCAAYADACKVLNVETSVIPGSSSGGTSIITFNNGAEIKYDNFTLISGSGIMKVYKILTSNFLGGQPFLRSGGNGYWISDWASVGYELVLPNGFSSIISNLPGSISSFTYTTRRNWSGQNGSWCTDPMTLDITNRSDVNYRLWQDQSGCSATGNYTFDVTIKNISNLSSSNASGFQYKIFSTGDKVIKSDEIEIQQGWTVTGRTTQRSGAPTQPTFTLNVKPFSKDEVKFFCNSTTCQIQEAISSSSILSSASIIVKKDYCKNGIYYSSVENLTGSTVTSNLASSCQ